MERSLIHPVGGFKLTSIVNQTNHIQASSAFTNIHRYFFKSSSQTLKINQAPILIFILFQTKFKQFLYSGNVVLLQLNKSIKFNENVTAACISDEPIDSERETCITVGWPMNNGKFPIEFNPFLQLH